MGIFLFLIHGLTRNLRTLQEGILISFFKYRQFVFGLFLEVEIGRAALCDDPFNMGCVLATYIGGYLS